MFVNNRLERKNLPKQSEYYDPLSYVDNNGKYIYSRENVSKHAEQEKEK